MTGGQSSRFNKHAWLEAVAASSVSTGAKLRAVAIWRFTDTAGFSYPNQEHIEGAIGNRSTARTAQFVRDLVDVGFIERRYAQGGRGFLSANYRLTTPTTVGTNTKNTSTRAPRKAPASSAAVAAPQASRTPTIDDFVVGGVDTRPPPPWAVG